MATLGLSLSYGAHHCLKNVSIYNLPSYYVGS
jgi:hypothetical protein